MSMHRRPKMLGTVLISINEEGGNTCVDLFRRTDGSFGYELYRRDHECGEGWFPIGFYSGSMFDTPEAAWRDARERVAWLPEQEDFARHGL